MASVWYQALCAALGLPQGSDEAATLIRKAYEEPEPPPQSARNTDAVYYSLLPDPTGREPPPAWSAERRPEAEVFEAWQWQIVCYGPNAMANAEKIRLNIFLDGNGFPRSILRKEGIYPVPNPNSPTLSYEPEATRWRKRADLTITLRIYKLHESPSNRQTISVPPKINIRTSRT